jgi:hypothetical protein
LFLFFTHHRRITTIRIRPFRILRHISQQIPVKKIKCNKVYLNP